MILRLVWWNVQDFTHFDPARGGETNWPTSDAEFQAKLQLLHEVLAPYKSGEPVVIALAEATDVALRTLRDKLLPTYAAFSLDMLERASPSVGLIYPNRKGFTIRDPLTVQNVPRTTRPMAVLDVSCGGHTVRIVACHWTARIGDGSDWTRSETARALARYVYDYLDEDLDAANKHMVILGDLNEEPFGLLERDLNAQRERVRAQRRHWTDRDRKRRYLYNISWRMLGERVPAAATTANHSAGTYYWADKLEWRTLDHIIVDGSLVGSAYPTIDEMQTGVVTHPQLFRGGRVPRKFAWDGSKATGGVSDHLPITTLVRFGDDCV